MLVITTRRLRTPKHEGLYRYGRRCGRHNLLLRRPLVGGMREAQPPPLALPLLFNTTRARSPELRAPKHEGRNRNHAMDGGVADTA
jgi:hypothetical protein